ncbi:MAG: NUDIX hydrolase [Leptolyngbyaceae cyanobacterium CAN_BIN12]|nr:NUDIX hydrolase [Leptolyngbyaceae cyanobacterium CAN_BIN12]
MPRSLEPWKTLDTKTIFSALPWLALSVEQVQLPDGQVVSDYYHIQLQDYAIVFVQVPDGDVILLRQYKHGVGRVSLTLPGGGLAADETPLAAAQRELLEETGYEAEDWQLLCPFVSSANYRCSQGYIFSAKNAYQVAEPNSGDLEEMETVLMPPIQVIEAVQQGEIVVLGALTAIALALNPNFRY